MKYILTKEELHMRFNRLMEVLSALLGNSNFAAIDELVMRIRSIQLEGGELTDEVFEAIMKEFEERNS